MTSPLFDEHIRSLRRRRSAGSDGDRFLHRRAFEDCLDRLSDIRRPFETAVIHGHPDPAWRDALEAILPSVVVIEGPAETAPFPPASFDLCLSIGEFEASNDLATSAFALRHLLKPGGLLIGAIIGGDSLPRLRVAMLAADRLVGRAAPRLHPTIDGPSLGTLLTSVGFQIPVVDVDRLDVAYQNLDRLVGDLRAMGCTNILAERSRVPLTRSQRDAARAAFLDGKDNALERFELLHFAAWAPA